MPGTCALLSWGSSWGSKVAARPAGQARGDGVVGSDSEVSWLHLVRAAHTQTCTLYIPVCTCTHTYRGVSRVPNTQARPSGPLGLGWGVWGAGLWPTSSSLKGGDANTRWQSQASVLWPDQPRERAGNCTRLQNSKTKPPQGGVGDALPTQDMHPSPMTE